jgi:Holliday junction resolvasome RuvABC endonuclease subunit
VILLSIDGSLTATGFAVVQLGPDAHDEHVLDTSVVRTKPDQKSRHLYQADQDGERVDAIARELLDLLRRYQVQAVACEAPAGSQHAGAAKALALVYGAIRGVLVAQGISPIMVQAHHAKKAAAGTVGASKDEVLHAMRARFSLALKGPKADREARADALAVACAALSEPSVQALRRLV